MENVDYKDITNRFIGNIYNGGFWQVCYNGIADKLAKIDVGDYFIEMNMLPKEFLKFMSKVFKIVKEKEPEKECPYCGGDGCEDCGDLGTIPAKNWRDADYEEDWMDALDREFYSPEMDKVVEQVIKLTEE